MKKIDAELCSQHNSLHQKQFNLQGVKKSIDLKYLYLGKIELNFNDLKCISKLLFINFY